MGALGSSYATASELEARVGRANPGTYDMLLDVASRTVEEFTGRQFNRTEVASSRRFRAVDWRRLPVDDFYSVTGFTVTVDGVVVPAANVDPRPWNGSVNGQLGWPFFDLYGVNRTWPMESSTAITVAALWGWTAVPEAIRQATLDVAAPMTYGSDGSSFPVASEAIDTYRVSYFMPGGSSGADVPSELLKAAPYRRMTFGVA